MATVSGLVFPTFTSGNVRSLEMHFEPSMGIAARRVDKLGLDIRSFREPLKRAVKEVVIPSIQMNFYKHGRPRWAPLVEETVKKKGSPVPLVDTGALKSTMNQIGIWHIDMEKALINELPANVWYGAIHQAGAGGHHESFLDEQKNQYVNVGDSGAIPARPFVMLQPEDEDNIETIFGEWLDERCAAAGFPTTPTLGLG